MKWTVALAGALLSLAGFYALYTGISIIQVERGWATFIAGAVFRGAGVIVLGIAALMGRVDYLAELYEEREFGKVIREAMRVAEPFVDALN